MENEQGNLLTYIPLALMTSLIATLKRNGTLSEANYNGLFVSLGNEMNRSGFIGGQTVVDAIWDLTNAACEMTPTLMVVDADGSLRPAAEQPDSGT